MTENGHGAPELGTAAERTDLAWNRSGLALLAVGAAVIRGFPPAGLPARQFVGAIVLVLGAFTWTFGAFEARRRFRRGLTPAVATRRGLLPVALGAASVGVAAFVVAAFDAS